ncbi:MAG: hypothetical protein KDI66_20130 [Xanthomonadales bacterium]|nr:hypothetical protein [Xanthomonadales bacterium]
MNASSATAEAFKLIGRKLSQEKSATASALRVLAIVECIEGECSYVVPPLGIEVSADASGMIVTVHLHSEGHEGFNAFPFSLEELTFSSSRSEVREKMGSPVRSGTGRTGEWDVYSRGEYVVHFMYAPDSLSIALVTLSGELET